MHLPASRTDTSRARRSTVTNDRGSVGHPPAPTRRWGRGSSRPDPFPSYVSPSLVLALDLDSGRNRRMRRTQGKGEARSQRGVILPVAVVRPPGARHCRPPPPTATWPPTPSFPAKPGTAVGVAGVGVGRGAGVGRGEWATGRGAGR